MDVSGRVGGMEERLEVPTTELGEQEKERVRRFIAALRSGAFRQAQRTLCRRPANNDVPHEHRYCCLGVACEVAIADGLNLVKVPYGVESVRYGGNDTGSLSLLPIQVQEWYGFGVDNPGLQIPVQLAAQLPDLGFPALASATQLNDSAGLSLAQIADCFEYTYLREDWEASHAG